MACKKKLSHQKNHERWLVSYADFMTLLFAVFVILYGFMCQRTRCKSPGSRLDSKFYRDGICHRPSRLNRAKR